jgi:ribosomal protein L24E
MSKDKRVVPKICHNCGKTVMKTRAEANARTLYFCNNKCYDPHKKKIMGMGKHQRKAEKYLPELTIEDLLR